MDIICKSGAIIVLLDPDVTRVNDTTTRELLAFPNLFLPNKHVYHGPHSSKLFLIHRLFFVKFCKHRLCSDFIPLSLVMGCSLDMECKRWFQMTSLRNLTDSVASEYNCDFFTFSIMLIISDRQTRPVTINQPALSLSWRCQITSLTIEQIKELWVAWLC